jgi:trimeric autotransporter adhesin
MKIRKAVFLIILPVICLVLLPRTQAVVPPPDGGYPNFTTAEGQRALFSLTNGAANTAVGWFSLFSVTTGSFNTGVGAATLVLNTGDDNTATGTAALLLNTTGANNTANGTAALVNNADGSDNTAVGAFALNNNTAGGNTAIGSNALLNNTTGGTLENIQGVDVGPNVAVGWQALESNTVASANTAVGYQALHSFTTGPTGIEQVGLCTAVGFQALANATGDGFANSAFGFHALVNDTEGSGNTAIGGAALLSNTTGSNNIALGFSAGSSLTTGDNNIDIGNAGILAESNTIRIGNPLHNATFIAGISGAAVTGTAVVVNANGQLGVAPSSIRFKEEIKPMSEASQALYALEPVTFHYKKEVDSAGTAQFGLVAEDVEKVNPDLVVHDEEGKPYSVRYDQINAMLLNEFLTEHRKNEEQEATIAELKSDAAKQQTTISQLKNGMDALVAQLKEQGAQIRRVSLQVELRRSATKLAGDNH